ncbi:glycoside hydrolase family 2 protein [Maribellus mangrovi]|uniref:glycoside hydrolase family 2 protein n=1 Tax=Maribellus mangrovi TaxID=3133146 RepID=UPI0030EF4E59
MRRRLFKSKSLVLLFALILGSLAGNSQQREQQLLTNEWKFVLADKELDYINLTDDSWLDVSVPHTWNSKDIQSGENIKYGTGWYKRELNVQKLENKQYFLKFEGVGQDAKVYINNEYVGEHLGSYSAFVFNITRFLSDEGINTLLVRVNNELTKSYPKDNYLFGVFGGIYREVKLITTEDLHFALTDNASSGIFVNQDQVSKKKAALRIVSNIKNETSTAMLVTVKNQLVSKDGKVVAEGSTEQLIYPGGFEPVSSLLEVKNPHLWNGRKDPYLYTLETEIVQNGTTVDKLKQAVGLRFYSIDPEKGFILNGEPYRLYGVCRHQEWEDLGNALLPKHHKQDMEMIYEIGATSIRLAHYEQADYMYSLADSMGILIWAEIPFVNGYNEGADDNAIQQLTELIKQRYNHPSIFVWGLHNEVVKNLWVTPPANLTKRLHSLAKTLDPSRYTVSVSNIWWLYDYPIHELANLQGFNQYTGWYGGKPEGLENWIKKYHSEKPDVRFSISEYGAGGNIAQQRTDIFPAPGPNDAFFPESYMTHYHEVTYSAIEKYPFIWGSYVWNMFDFSTPEWDRGGIKGRNHKGLVTYDRQTKKDVFFWYKANWSEEAVVYLTGRRNNHPETDTLSFGAYSNRGIPELFINGKSQGKMSAGINSVKFVSPEIKLEKGENKIELKVEADGKSYHDEFVLYID